MHLPARLATQAAMTATLACSLALMVAGPAFGVEGRWMTEASMRSQFIGKTLDGYYTDGVEWTETYGTDGRLDYKESTTRSGPGSWFFRGPVFCTFYDPGHGLSGGCFMAVQASANCYEFYVADLKRPVSEQDDADAGPGPLGRWIARAWRREAPSTCEPVPTV